MNPYLRNFLIGYGGTIYCLNDAKHILPENVVYPFETLNEQRARHQQEIQIVHNTYDARNEGMLTSFLVTLLMSVWLLVSLFTNSPHWLLACVLMQSNVLISMVLGYLNYRYERIINK